MSSAHALYTAAQVRELDRRAIEDHAIDGYDLMGRAAAAAWRVLRLRWPGARSLAVYCGGGNNGGDGLVLARLAQAAGRDVRLALAGDPGRLKGAAARAWQDWADAGGHAVALDELDPAAADVVVDALLGTGLDRPVEGAIATAIGRINAAAQTAGWPVLALDIPSGLDADSGAVLGTAVMATATLTFIGAKRGLYTGAASDYTGPVFVDDLAVPQTVYAGMVPSVRAITPATAQASLPRLRPGAHKGDRGHVLVVGGDAGYAGAPRLAAEAALHAGAGRVTVLTRPAHAAGVTAARPELMARGLEAPATELPDWLAHADAVVLGPGLGQGDWGCAALAALAVYAPARLLLDADALNGVATGAGMIPAGSVITPHPGEAARLLGTDTATVQADRFAALAALVERFEATVVLKGAGTLVGSPESDPAMLPLARPALSVGGSGDVLGGVIAALLAGGRVQQPPREAAEAGVWLHAQAALTEDGRPPLPGELGAHIAGLRARLARTSGEGAR